MKKDSSMGIVDTENQADCRRAKAVSLIIHEELEAFQSLHLPYSHSRELMWMGVILTGRI